MSSPKGVEPLLKCETTRFGQIEVDESEIITFPSGILGFEQARRYVLIERDQKSPFRYLQSLDDPDLTFVVAEPTSFRPDYRVTVWPDDVREIRLEREEDAVVCVIVRVPEELDEMTANLKAPLVINAKDRLGKQVVQVQDGYGVRHRIVDEIERAKRLSLQPDLVGAAVRWANDTAG